MYKARKVSRWREKILKSRENNFKKFMEKVLYYAGDAIFFVLCQN